MYCWVTWLVEEGAIEQANCLDHSISESSLSLSRHHVEARAAYQVSLGYLLSCSSDDGVWDIYFKRLLPSWAVSLKVVVHTSFWPLV